MTSEIYALNYRSMELERSQIDEQLARIGKVIANPKRIELLDLLCQGERSVDALARAARLKVTTTSAHLQIMRNARLVATRKSGTRVYYRAADEAVCRFVTSLLDLGRSRLAEVQQILREVNAGTGEVERVSRTDLLERVRDGQVVVVDVRPFEEYAEGHIPGARSMPLEHLEAHLADLDPAVEVVAYCRGPLCLMAPEAVHRLEKHGFKARCLEDGMPQWRQSGLPVEMQTY